MTQAAELLGTPLPFVALALAACGLLLAHERRHQGMLNAFVPLIVLAPLAGAIAYVTSNSPAWPPLAVGLVTAVLARNREDLLHSECALKLLWVMCGALALSWAGAELLVLATGTTEVAEQWAVLRLDLDPPFLWKTALPLSLLVGLVMLAGAPFHFWAADMFQGVRAWLAPLAVAALQVAGAGWLQRRLVGIQEFPEAAELAESLLGFAALIALVAGAATIVSQRRPERRVGTLASLNGALVLAAMATTHDATGLDAQRLGLWAGHLALALVGASTLARFMPVSTDVPGSAPVLFRRHALGGLMGMYALCSLAGVPGTPGSRLWLGIAHELVVARRTWLLVALAIAWLAAFSSAARQLREAVGVRVEAAAPEQRVPWQVRATMWLAGGGLLAAFLTKAIR